MSDKRCPTEAELLRFIDEDLSPENLARIRAHLDRCVACSSEVSELRELIGDVVAPRPLPPLDVGSHVAAVMDRLDTPLEAARQDALNTTSPAPRARTWAIWAGALAAAAALCVLVLNRAQQDREQSEFAARGSAAGSSLSRDIGLQLYSQATSVHALVSGERIASNAALTAGLRNLGDHEAHLLLFAVDASQSVHWIAPAYTLEGSDPAAASIAPAKAERLLPSSASFDDLAPGPLRVIAVITREPTRVSSVEQLPVTELNAEALLERFGNAEVRQFLLEVTP